MSYYFSFHIDGMSCQNCATNIEKKIHKFNPSFKANVNFATETLSIQSPQKDIEKKIMDLFKNTNYTISTSTIHSDRYSKKNVFPLGLGVSLILGILILWIAMFKPIQSYFSPFTFAGLQFFISLPILIYGKDFFIRGYKNLIQLTPNMDTLIAIGTSAAFLYSLLNTVFIYYGEFSLIHQLYYESACIIIVLISLGKYLEKNSKRKVSSAIQKLIQLSPKIAWIKQKDTYIQIPVEEIQKGDILRIKPGEQIPVDGIVIEGVSSVDESMITGESIPIEKLKNSLVSAGTINQNGSILIIAKKVGSETLLSKIIHTVEQAQSRKAPIAKIADDISGIFVPVVICISIISSILWYFITFDLGLSIKIFVSVLVISCPCALGLATPIAILIGTSRGADQGILFKGGDIVEKTSSIDTFVFDKTGTLTTGELDIHEIIVLDSSYNQKKILQIAASLEALSEHPISKAIVRKADSESITLFQIHDFINIPGKGVQGMLDNCKIIIGTQDFIKECGISVKEVPFPKNYAKETTLIWVAIDQKLIGVITVSDQVRSDSKQTIESLKKLGIECIMLTGDSLKVAKEIGRQVGIDKIIAEVLPTEKGNELETLKVSGKQIAMIGDGINDAPALAVANIGIALHSGTDIAMETADIVLIDNKLKKLTTMMEISYKTMRIIKQNLFWAFIYNILGIPIAAGALYIFGIPGLNPMIAALAMVFSSLSVILNTLRLKIMSFD